MNLNARNFTVKQIGSRWRVVGPGGKFLDGEYRLRQQALVALKSAVDKLLEERKFGFLKQASENINQEIKKEVLNEENANEDVKRNEGNYVKRDGLEAKTEDRTQETSKKEEKVIKKRGRPKSTVAKIKAKHGIKA